MNLPKKIRINYGDATVVSVDAGYVKELKIVSVDLLDIYGGNKMSQHKHRRQRQCKKCGKLMYGTAMDLTDHRSEHQFARRTGLYLAPATIIAGDTLFKVVQCEVRKENDTHGNR